MGNDACINLEAKATELMGDHVSLGGSGAHGWAWFRAILPQQAVELHITCQLVPSCTRSGHHKCIVAHTSLFGVSLYAGGSTALITYYLTGNGGTVLDVIKVGGWALCYMCWQERKKERLRPWAWVEGAGRVLSP